eukprot:m.372348 g.372348  ORF g.372348 m.372348 type:complete len:56 (-) comp62817_c0_seq1:70-237(-)
MVTLVGSNARQQVAITRTAQALGCKKWKEKQNRHMRATLHDQSHATNRIQQIGNI